MVTREVTTHRHRRSFDAHVESIGVSRRWCRSLLAAEGWMTRRANEIELCATELVTNAIAHGVGDRVVVRLRHEVGRQLELDVSSLGAYHGSPTWPPEHVPPSQTDGRGLLLAYAVSDEMELRCRPASVSVVARFRPTR